ncbi:MAG: AN1-type zinc finger domain-containing protein [Thaumarchaeota archaeon]|nr:AN1-type zinc finger domain-containing protein [Nitrososphaerota archaeon]
MLHKCKFCEKAFCIQHMLPERHACSNINRITTID